MNVSSLYNSCCYKNACKGKSENCEDSCIIHKEMNYLLNHCGIDFSEDIISFPLEKDNLNNELLNIRKNISNFVLAGGNLFITSNEKNNGKTSISVKLMYKYFDEVAIGNSFRQRGYFVYIPEFIPKIRTFDYRETNEFKRLDEILKNVDLVIWDDITGFKLNSADQNNLYSYLGYRKTKRKANIFNGLLYEDMQEIVGKKIEEKLMEESVVIELE